MKQIGRIIYSYRKVQGLSQEELADIVGVSSAAVSKWERNLSVPDVEVLCQLADYFEVTLDDLMGRSRERQTAVRFDNQADADRFFLAEELLECCRKARNFGLLAMEEQVRKKEGSVYNYLKFSVDFLMQGFQRQMIPEEIERFLLRYAEAERDVRTAKMISEVIPMIASGKNEEVIREVLRSHLGRKYARMLAESEAEKRRSTGREEMIAQYCACQSCVSDTGLLDDLQKASDKRIQQILRSLTSEEFAAAMAGASQEVRKRLFHNLSDRMIWVLGEDLLNFAGDMEEVKEAQRRMLEILGE